MRTQVDTCWDPGLLSPPACSYHSVAKLLRDITILCAPGNNIRHLILCEYPDAAQERPRCCLLQGDFWLVLLLWLAGYLSGRNAMFVLLRDVSAFPFSAGQRSLSLTSSLASSFLSYFSHVIRPQRQQRLILYQESKPHIALLLAWR